MSSFRTWRILHHRYKCCELFGLSPLVSELFVVVLDFLNGVTHQVLTVLSFSLATQRPVPCWHPSACTVDPSLSLQACTYRIIQVGKDIWDPQPIPTMPSDHVQEALYEAAPCFVLLLRSCFLLLFFLRNFVCMLWRNAYFWQQVVTPELISLVCEFMPLSLSSLPVSHLICCLSTVILGFFL